jgi:hypothetical protein
MKMSENSALLSIGGRTIAPNESILPLLKQDACPYPIQVLLDILQSLDHAIAIYRRKSSKDYSGWLSSGMRIHHKEDSLGSHNITIP